ncbi:uncharacterized protein [Hoplias malabaricus]|uniref:uncharacterized protein isoform X3 n=1 Tax=Hoplias malabaricus TaxID=27720 RepID=UPI0034626573
MGVCGGSLRAEERDMTQDRPFLLCWIKLRVVVFGWKFSGKTSLISAVFGKELFPNKKKTAQCKKVRDTVCGRDLTLVDTPGWWKHFPVNDTPHLLKQELVRGVYLCDPGPHAVLVVIEIDNPFTEKHRKAVEDHIGLLGDQIWTHALVVFTRSYALRDRTIEDHIKTEGESLQWVIEKCGNRYHVFDSADFDECQVKQLLEKIEDVVQRNDGFYFKMEPEKLEAVAEWKKTVMIDSRILKLQQQKTNLNKEELRITLLGWVISGKSSAGNVILNRKAFAPAREMSSKTQMQGHSDQTKTQSCSQEKEQRTLKLKEHVKNKLDREWGRREDAIKGKFQEFLSELGCEPQVLGEEFKRKENQFLNRVSEVIAEFPSRTNSSMDFPPGLSEMSLKTPTEDHRKEEESQTESQSHNKSTLPLKAHIKEMLDREWCRREEALMGRVLEMLSELRCEVMSETSEHEKVRSFQKVSQWFERWSEGYASASSNSVSDT